MDDVFKPSREFVKAYLTLGSFFIFCRCILKIIFSMDRIREKQSISFYRALYCVYRFTNAEGMKEVQIKEVQITEGQNFADTLWCALRTELVLDHPCVSEKQCSALLGLLAVEFKN